MHGRVTSADGASAPPHLRAPGAAHHYRPEIDGLRCLAVVPVILYHANIAPFTGGYVGVDIFFVISGYLITSILLADLRKGRFSFANFYERRIRRIFPALFFVTAATMAAAWFILTPSEMESLSQSIAATIAFASNILFYLNSGYFTADVETMPLIHMWSLAVEEQFYIFFPIILLALHRSRKLPLASVLVAALVISFAACVYYQPIDQMAAFFLTPFRAWELTCGALVATAGGPWTDWISRHRRIAIPLEAIGLAMIAGTIVLIDSATDFPGWFAVPPVLGAALIIMASSPATPIGKLLSTRLFVGIGLISYSAYLWHQPLFALTRSYLGEEPTMGLYSILIGLTFGFAYLSWRFVERPFRSRNFLTRRTLFRLAAAGSAAFALFGLAGHLTNGYPSRFSGEQLALAKTMDISPKRVECHTDGLDYRPPQRACTYLGADTSWAIFGDSHAIELGYALAENLQPQGKGVLHLSFSGCPPAYSFNSEIRGCQQWVREAVAELEGRNDIRNVLLVFRHGLHLQGDQRLGEQARPYTFLPDAEQDERAITYWRSFEALVQRLTGAGKQVYIVAPVPELPKHIEAFIFKGKSGESAGVSLREFQRRHSDTLLRMAILDRSPGVTVLHPADALCHQGRCAAINGREALYFDDNHLSLAGASLVIAHERARGRLPLPQFKPGE